jgi:hypothetical protein
MISKTLRFVKKTFYRRKPENKLDNPLPNPETLSRMPSMGFTAPDVTENPVILGIWSPKRVYITINTTSRMIRRSTFDDLFSED